MLGLSQLTVTCKSPLLYPLSMVLLKCACFVPINHLAITKKKCVLFHLWKIQNEENNEF